MNCLNQTIHLFNSVIISLIIKGVCNGGQLYYFVIVIQFYLQTSKHTKLIIGNTFKVILGICGQEVICCDYQLLKIKYNPIFTKTVIRQWSAVLLPFFSNVNVDLDWIKKTCGVWFITKHTSDGKMTSDRHGVC